MIQPCALELVGLDMHVGVEVEHGQVNRGNAGGGTGIGLRGVERVVKGRELYGAQGRGRRILTGICPFCQ